MNTKFGKKLLSVFLMVALVLSYLPAVSFADDTTTATAISSLDALVTGQYVLVAQGKGRAMTAKSGTWVEAVDVTETDGVIADVPSAAIVTITKTANGYVLTDSAGNDLAPVSNSNSIAVEAGYEWAVTYESGAFIFRGKGSALAYNSDSQYKKFRAYKNDGGTQVKKLSLYALNSNPGPGPEPGDGRVTSLDQLTDGATVVIYNPAHSKALSSVFTGNYLSGVAVTVTEDSISGYAVTEIWTVGVTDDGKYTFSTQDGHKLSMAAQYSSTPLDAENDTWTVTPVEGAEGNFFIDNVGRGKRLEWYDSQNDWSTHTGDGELFQQSFWLVDPNNIPGPEPGTDTYATLMSELPGDGDQILIYNPANTAVLGSEASGSKMGYVTKAAEDGRIALAEGMGTVTVSIVGETEDGASVYAFAIGDQYLTSGATGNSLGLQAELTDCGKWTFEAQEDGSLHIHSEGANYNGNYNQYLEFYNGYTTFGFQSSNAQRYRFELYLVKAAAYLGPVTSLEQLTDGLHVVVYNPAHNKALSSVFTGNYLSGVDVTVTEDSISGYGTTEIWTVGVTEDGKYTFSTLDGHKLSMAATYSSTPLDAENDTWTVTAVEGTEGNFYIDNVGRNKRLEWYASQNDWSTYTGTSELFQQRFWSVEIPDTPTPEGLPQDGDVVVIHNAEASGVIGIADGTAAMSCVAAEVSDGIATAGNGAIAFTVGREGDAFTFACGNRYLASNNDEDLFLTETLDGNAKWTLEEKNGGYLIKNTTANYNGTKVCIEFFSGSFSCWTYKPAESAIFEFNFYPLAEGTQINDGVVNQPQVVWDAPDAYRGVDYVFSFTVDAVFGVDESSLAVTCNGEPMTPGDDGKYTVAAEDLPEGATMTLAVSGQDTKGVAFSGEAVVTIKDEPVISDIRPAMNAQTGDDKRPEIGAAVVNAGEDPVITMTLNGEEVEASFDGSRVFYISDEDMPDGKVTVVLTVTRADGVSSSRMWTFTVGVNTYQLYFGQLHSHTQYSDGSGSLETALEYVKNLPASANVQFVAFTDHSNYFDTTASANPEGALYNMSLASASSQALWNSYTTTIRSFNEENAGTLVAIPGFEMTWSGGPGHINTWATPGIVSRNNTTLNNKTDNAGLRAYYALLSQPEGVDSVSQFNHPGKTFGNFIDFSYWDAVIDTRIYTVEVGNGEGQIGAGGYYPSYEQYVMALDKGWHVAPTNNQDNHKGKWGNANDARDVILTDDFSEEGLLAAIRAMRMYATEDKNLELSYTVNGQVLGSVIEEVPEQLDIAVSFYDPDASDSITKVEVVVNSGKTVYAWEDAASLANGEVSVTLTPDYSYYFIRVTEGDNDIAVTAPVWVGETLKLGISDFVCGTSTPVTDEALTLTTTLFNSEAEAAQVKSLTYSIQGGEVLYTDTSVRNLPASGTLNVDFEYTPNTAKVMTITVVAVIEQDGKEYVFSKDLTLDVLDADSLVYIGIDASHYNEYVAGNYADSMGNFGKLAASYSVRTVELKTSQELIDACSNDKYVAMIFTAPSRRLSAAQSDPRVYSAEEIAAIDAFNQNGGVVVMAGWSDYYENYSAITGNPSVMHMAETQNSVLEALGSVLRIGDDATNDDSLNGGQSQRLYFSTYNFDSFLMEGVEVDEEHPNDRLYSEVFSQYGGASVFIAGEDGTATPTVPENVTTVVFGHTSTYLKDNDNDGKPMGIKYPYAEGDERYVVLATEEIEGRGIIIVSGAAFMSNFEVQATIEDNGSEKNYSNYKVCENLLSYLNPVVVTDIGVVNKVTEAGYKYTIEGVVTSNASGYDKDTAFFDCIYVQDETGGICCFPVAGNYKVGDLVRVSGVTDFYQGEPELQVISIEKIGEGGEVSPKEATAAQINDLSVLGELVTVRGTAVSYEVVDGLIQTIMVEDENGGVCRVFIDGYITIENEVEGLSVGCGIEATGLSSYDDTFNAPEGPFPRIRIRNRADIVCTPGPVELELEAELVSGGVQLTWAISRSGGAYEIYRKTGSGEWEKIGETSESTYKDTSVDVLTSYEYQIRVELGESNVAEITTGRFLDVLPGDSYNKAVNWAVENGIVNGTSATTFSPKDPCTRAQFALMLYRLAGKPAVDMSTNPFTDLPNNNGIKRAIVWAYNEGIVNGTSATTFSPEKNITRAQLTLMLYKMAGKPDVTGLSCPFEDLDGLTGNNLKAVIWAYNKGIVKGTGATTFSPKANCTRGQLVIMLYRFNRLQGYVPTSSGPVITAEARIGSRLEA